MSGSSDHDTDIIMTYWLFTYNAVRNWHFLEFPWANTQQFLKLFGRLPDIMDYNADICDYHIPAVKHPGPVKFIAAITWNRVLGCGIFLKKFV